MQFEKRLVQIFKAFVEKNLIPQIQKTQGSVSEWNKFSSLLTTDSINYSELQTYVDMLPSFNNSLQAPSTYERNKSGGMFDNKMNGKR